MDLTAPQLRRTRLLAEISRDVYNPDRGHTQNWRALSNAEIDGLGMSSSLLSDMLVNEIARSDGLRAGLYQTDAGETVLAFAGTNFSSQNDWVTNIVQGIGLNTKEYEKAAIICLLYTSPSPRDATLSRMPSSA